MALMKWIQALMLTFSLIFIAIFVFLFINNDQMANQSARKSKSLSLDGNQVNSVESTESTINLDKPQRDSNKDDSEIIVTTKFGKIRGFTQQVLGSKVATFLGVPYASPPMGQLRFKRTVPPMPWPDHALIAKQFKPKCAQLKKQVDSFTDVSSGMSEDCLYLNVWSTNYGRNRTQLKPVMIWIYGGGFFMGTSNFDESDGRVLAALGDVVVVTFDYRVGALGFIDLDTDRYVADAREIMIKVGYL